MIIPRIANFYKIQIRYFKRFFIFCSNFAKKVVSANRKSTNYQYANHKKDWVRKSPIHTVSRLRMSVLELKTTISPLPLTAKNQYPKFETNIPEKELRGHSPNFHIHVPVGDIFHHRSAYSAAGNMWTDQGII
jgi:hypothetical protein